MSVISMLVYWCRYDKEVASTTNTVPPLKETESQVTTNTLHVV